MKKVKRKIIKIYRGRLPHSARNSGYVELLLECGHTEHRKLSCEPKNMARCRECTLNENTIL